MIAIGKKDPAVEQRKKSASMPPMLKFEEKEEAPVPASEPEAEPLVAEAEPEVGGDYGAKLLGDMVAPLAAAGMDEATAKSTLAQIFKAAAACLEGGSATPEAAEPALEELLG